MMVITLIKYLNKRVECFPMGETQVVKHNVLIGKVPKLRKTEK